MAITKMKTVIMSGPVEQFDYIAEKYIYGRDIHLENAMLHLANRRSLTAFEDSNEYEMIAKSAMSAMERIGCGIGENASQADNMSIQEMQDFIDEINRVIEAEQQKQDTYSEELKANRKTIERMEKLSGIGSDILKLTNLEFIKCKFGHIPKANYKTLTTYLDDVEAVFVKTSETATDVWGLYFVPASEQQRTEEIFRSLYFEEKHLPDTHNGTPDEIKRRLTERNAELEDRLSEADSNIKNSMRDMTKKLQAIYNLAKRRCRLSEIRRNAARGVELFYIIGWMGEDDAKLFEKEIDRSADNIMLHVEDAAAEHVEPPTKLRNCAIFRPFEMFVKMYGLPKYNEIDPTPILAITYMLFFGIMFGDVGQSALFAILGFIVYKIKKMPLAGIVGWVGVTGVIFGFIYGSFFGNEELIPEFFGITPIRPMEQAIMMLGATIGVGVIVIIFGMILNIINAFKAKHKGEAIFGHNGMAGLVFYLSFLLLAGNIFLKWGIPNKVFGIIILIAVAVMYMCEPLSDLIEGKKHWLPKDGMFYVENLFEMFEVILSFFTNTISFLRIGAFAIVHVGMMMVVAILTPASVGVGSILVMVIGNAVVMVLEGLIVGIQVLRLEYYEMFSRYFTSGGREFVSLQDK